MKTHEKEELKNSRVKFNIAPLPIQNILSAQFVFSQILRISRLCYEEKNCEDYRSQMKSSFFKKAYSGKCIEKLMIKVKFSEEGIETAR